MRLFIAAAVSSLIILSSPLFAEARGGHSGGSVGTVRSYVKRDGTVVAAHYRTAPDARLDNNLSYRGRSTLRGDIPQTVGAIPQTTGVIPQAAISDVAPEAGLTPIKAAELSDGPGIHRHHVSCPTEKKIGGGTDPYNTFCLIN